MPNRAYVSIWIKGFDETNMLSFFERFVGTAPLTREMPSYTELIVRAVDSTETPIREFDLRARAIAPAEITELAQECLSADVSLEVAARWDLWMRDIESASWKKKPEPLILSCFGPDYDSRVFTEAGHLKADIGFEHIFTGHAGLLTTESSQVTEPEHPDEARFLMWMSQPKNLREYAEKTRENIQKLMGWMRAIEESLPVERVLLWSEGEENFEARLDEILAVR